MRINNQEVVKIGQGQFTSAYRVPDSDVVYLLSKVNNTTNDYVKEIYTHIQHPHIPVMETLYREVYFSRMGYRNIYKTRYYNPLTAQSTTAWAHYKTLKNTWERIRTSKYKKPDNWYQYMGDFIDTLRDEQSVPNSIIDALDLLYSWVTAYGSNFLLEFSPRNLKVDDHGNLILLDIIFFQYR